MSLSGRRLVLRADGSSSLGLGHISRALALAEMFTESEVVFHTRCRIPDVQNAISERARLVVMDESVPVTDEADAFARTLTGDDTVVLDGNQFDEGYQRTIKRRGCMLVCVDDLATRTFHADLIINDSGGIAPDRYACTAPARFCLGPAFAILRTPFLEAARTRRPFSPNDNVFVCLGGADPNNELPQVLGRARHSMPDRHFEIVVGAAYGHQAALREFLMQHTIDVTLHLALPPRAMAALMARCAAAITSPSTVSFEYASVGGVLYLHQIAADQTLTSRWLLESGLAFPFAGTQAAPAAQERAIARQREVFDGHSDERLRASIDALARV